MTSHDKYNSGNDGAPRITLDDYNGDLDFVIEHPECLIGSTQTLECFSQIWSGCRATHGARGGKVCYEVLVLENTQVSAKATTPVQLQHLLRVGWSAVSQTYDLGDEACSYGYGGTGKSSQGGRFVNYGQPFGVGDVITCYLDLDGPQRSISFAKNGHHLGTCFPLAPDVVHRAGALFPHILCKNVKVRCNFGRSRPAFPILHGYRFLEDADRQVVERGPVGPKDFGGCEVIMMVGLPASGKTTWANNMVARHPEKRYNVLGTNNIMDKMKVMGLTRKRNYHGRFEMLMQEAGKVHSKLLQIAQNRRRNFILDQTNVYGSAQKRKMNNFRRFGRRRAMVIVVTNEELSRRQAKREREEGKLVPDEAVMEMKANITLPTTDGGVFTSVDFAEEGKEAAEVLVEHFHSDAKEFFRLNPAKRSRPFGPPSRGGHSPSPGYQSPLPSPSSSVCSSPYHSPAELTPYASPRHSPAPQSPAVYEARGDSRDFSRSDYRSSPEPPAYRDSRGDSRGLHSGQYAEREHGSYGSGADDRRDSYDKHSGYASDGRRDSYPARPDDYPGREQRHDSYGARPESDYSSPSQPSRSGYSTPNHDYTASRHEQPSSAAYSHSMNAHRLVTASAVIRIQPAATLRQVTIVIMKLILEVAMAATVETEGAMIGLPLEIMPHRTMPVLVTVH